MASAPKSASGRMALLRGWAFGLALLAAGCVATYQGPPPGDHYTDGRFRNIGSFVEPVATANDWADHAHQMLNGLFPDAYDLPENHVLPPDQVRAGLERAANASLAVTWIGHATTLIRIGGQWVLTDPVFMHTVGAGPLRVLRHAPAAPGIDELPPIDVIVISHADHDHLDIPSLRRLANRHPNAAVYVPLGVGNLVRLSGFRNVTEMDWYETRHHDDLAIEAVPAIHGVRRPPYVGDSMLWAGWILRDNSDAVYFAGDTGFGSIFEEMRRRSGAVDVALVPIGAWSPRWFQAPFHVDPDEAAEIARIMGAPTAIGIHWGTFPLSEEAPTEQKSRFLAAGGRGVEAIVPKVGETFVLKH
ncbi:MBL fold metallo-hydrolase [Bauldia sp.]|uniref:MBL fold metallo-hydrolase n=1 Tax=Bauldia sp. TaxID=2575872 RepID=UPI003BAA690A